MRTPARALGRWAVRPEGEGLLVGEGLSRLARQQCTASRCCHHPEGMNRGDGPGREALASKPDHPLGTMTAVEPVRSSSRLRIAYPGRSGRRGAVASDPVRCAVRPKALRVRVPGNRPGVPLPKPPHGLEAAATDGPEAMTASRYSRLRGHPTTMVPVLSGGPQITPRVVDDVQPGAVGLAPRHLSRRGAKVDRFAIGPVALQ
jgi:hypothetical protein